MSAKIGLGAAMVGLALSVGGCVSKPAAMSVADLRQAAVVPRDALPRTLWVQASTEPWACIPDDTASCRTDRGVGRRICADDGSEWGPCLDRSDPKVVAAERVQEAVYPTATVDKLNGRSPSWWQQPDSGEGVLPYPGPNSRPLRGGNALQWLAQRSEEAGDLEQAAGAWAQDCKLFYAAKSGDYRSCHRLFLLATGSLKGEARRSAFKLLCTLGNPWACEVGAAEALQGETLQDARDAVRFWQTGSRIKQRKWLSAYLAGVYQEDFVARRGLLRVVPRDLDVAEEHSWEAKEGWQAAEDQEHRGLCTFVRPSQKPFFPSNDQLTSDCRVLGLVLNRLGDRLAAGQSPRVPLQEQAIKAARIYEWCRVSTVVLEHFHTVDDRQSKSCGEKEQRLLGANPAVLAALLEEQRQRDERMRVESDQLERENAEEEKREAEEEQREQARREQEQQERREREAHDEAQRAANLQQIQQGAQAVAQAFQPAPTPNFAPAPPAAAGGSASSRTGAGGPAADSGASERARVAQAQANDAKDEARRRALSECLAKPITPMRPVRTNPFGGYAQEYRTNRDRLQSSCAAPRPWKDCFSLADKATFPDERAQMDITSFPNACWGQPIDAFQRCRESDRVLCDLTLRNVILAMECAESELPKSWAADDRKNDVEAERKRDVACHRQYGE